MLVPSVAVGILRGKFYGGLWWVASRVAAGTLHARSSVTAALSAGQTSLGEQAEF